MTKEEIIGWGAEALLIRSGEILKKRRIKKGYRHNALDVLLRASRTRREARLLEKASGIISVPRIRAIDGMPRERIEPETEIEMEFVDGKVLSQWLDEFPLTKALTICKKIGANVAKLHDFDIIHGDLTTSNMILKQEQVYFIDFGLGFHSARAEDKAVDLHLLREALEAKHFKHGHEYFGAVIEGYKISKNARKVIERLKKVEHRGRYKGKA
ncbi:MAG: Kae1-associated serine/threonine protein kinase [Candidatus Pacearchaeota archaeon]|nr:Kae1-associated serine/threonine protein kinase [Candidatus Pacearchaeota archaeon]